MFQGTQDQGRIDRSILRDAVALAVRAPSIHNTQPWLWRLSSDRIDLYADPSRQLAVVDPIRRGLLVSCGAALAQARWALINAGWQPTETLLPDPSNRDHLATLEIAEHSEVTAEVQWLVDAAWRRRTDRRPFRPVPVAETVISTLRQAAEAEGAMLQHVTRPDDRLELAVAVGEADSAEATDPAYVAEMQRWTGRSSDDVDGVPTSAVPDLPHRQADVALRGFAVKAPGTLDVAQPAAVEHPSLLVLATRGDSDADRLRAGEALVRVLLTAAKVDLAVSPYTQPLEVPGPAHVLRRLLSGVGVPQMVLRVGWAQEGRPLKLTPRRPLDDVIID